MYLYEKMIQKKQEISKQLNDIQMSLSEQPSGTLTCARNGMYYKWYQTTDGTTSYLPKDKRELAEKLAVKRYLSCLQEDLRKEQYAIESYLRLHEDLPKAERIMKNPEYAKLLSAHFQPLSQELSEWMNMPYERNMNYPENIVHRSCSGNVLRSKSEAIIDMILYMNKIPFRYECALQLGEVLLFPDFTIRHPITGKTFYWEHWGLMDNASYRQNTFSKLELYASHDIIPTINLITTYETKDCPLSTDTIMNVVQQYFL